MKKEDPIESDSAIGVVIESEDSDGVVEKTDHLVTTKESSEEVIGDKKVKRNQMEGISVLKQGFDFCINLFPIYYYHYMYLYLLYFVFSAFDANGTMINNENLTGLYDLC